MTEITIWILVAFSNGAYNGGNSTVIDRFASEEACVAARAQTWNAEKTFNNQKWATCIKAKVVR